MRILGALLFLAAMVAFAALAVSGCTSQPNPNAPDSVAVRKAAQRACVAKGEVLIAMAHSNGEDCSNTTARLQQLAREDEDCLVYFGDAGVQVKDLCQ